MSDTQKNREAIEAMHAADASSIAIADEQELIEQALIQNALGPERMRSADGEELIAKPVQELIAVDQHLTNKAAASRANRGLMFSQFIPPGGGGTP